MRGSRRVLFGGALCAASLVPMSGGASAECVRHVFNRSPLVLVASQEGGLSTVVRPGSSRAIRLSGPGKLDLAGYCAPRDLRGDPATFGPPVVQESFGYQAVQDRCFFEFGHDFYKPELGRGFLPYESTAPFALNTPRQGDVVLYTDRNTCLPER